MFVPVVELAHHRKHGRTPIVHPYQLQFVVERGGSFAFPDFDPYRFKIGPVRISAEAMVNETEVVRVRKKVVSARMPRMRKIEAEETLLYFFDLSGFVAYELALAIAND